MASTCSVCGTSLGFGRRLSGKSLCETHEAELGARQKVQAAARAVAAHEYAAVAASIVKDPNAVQRLPAIAARAEMTEDARRRANALALAGLLAAAIDDAYLSEEEENALNRAVKQLELTDEEVVKAVGPRAKDAAYARLNAGRLPILEDPAIFLKPKEVAHLQVDAALLKEVVHRESRGGYSGFSIPIVAGVRYRVGGYRGRSVIVGTSIEVADTGVLCITSHRAVFKGMRQNVECLYGKLVGVNVFDDGIQFHVSNRQKATLLRVSDGHLVAAAVNVALHPEGVSR